MVSDLKEGIRSCSAAERAEITAYLRVLDRLHDADFQNEMKLRAQEMVTGRRVVGGNSVEELDRMLSDRGL